MIPEDIMKTRMFPILTPALLPLFLASTLLFCPVKGQAQEETGPNALKLGDLVVDPPTYICLGFQWFGEGDANRNATVKVEYRKAGEDDWHETLPMLRLRAGENVPLLAGSILDLDPGTDYECRLTAEDPDGVEGEAERIVTARTRNEAVIPEDLEVRHAYMAEFRGERQEPAFTGLLHALWGGHLYQRRNSDWAGGGDMILIHAGHYAGKRFDKRDWRGHLLFDATGWHGYPVRQANDPERPLVIKPAGDGPVVIDGSGMPELFDMAGARNVIIEGLTIQNCGIVFQFSEARDQRPSQNITIRNCVFRDVASVAKGDHPGNRNITITDCLIQGRQLAVIGSWGSTFSRQAVTISGKGHVFKHNRVEDVFDYVNVAPSGTSAIDVYNNDVRRAGDNAICFNGVSHNCRALRNRVFNGGDPQFDNRNQFGPTYWVRNLLYNMRSDRGFKNDGGIGGLVALHNTMTAYPLNMDSYNYCRLANNLFLGGPNKGGKALAANILPQNRNELSHNGYLLRNAKFAYAGKEFEDLEPFIEASEMAEGSIGVDFEDFVDAPNPHDLEPEHPHNVALIDPATIDFRLAEGSEPVDAAKLIPGINDNFIGDAPDMGALERGQDVPVYGPRTPLPESWVMKEPGTVTAELPEAPGGPVIRVSCGTPWPYEDPAGNIWQGDQPYHWPADWGYVGDPNAWHDQISRGEGVGAPLTQLYRFERSGLEAYVFTVPPGNYKVRLHFIERWGQGRLFDVVVNNTPALENFDIFQEAGGDHKPVTQEIETTVTGDQLSIQFLPRSENSPIINGIEIFRAE